MAFAVLMGILVLSTQSWAQDAVSSYKVGERVENREGYPPREVWHEGTIVKVYPDNRGVLVHWDPRPDYAPYTHNGVSIYEQAYDFDSVRHIKTRVDVNPEEKKDDTTPSLDPAGNAEGDRKVGDKVDFRNISWYQGTILEIGSGSYDGYYRVHWDKASNEGGEWVSAKNIRDRQSTAKPNASHGPRAGKYIIRSYGDITNPILIGYFVLSGSSYQYFSVTGKAIGSGGYTYDAGASAVQWTSGPFKQAGWTGKFRIERGGKTHIIQLNTATIGSNTTDS